MADPRSGKIGLLRDLNLNIILNIIAKKGPLSRVEVVRQSGLPQATVSRITNEFLEAGLILKERFDESSGGRPPRLLQLNPTAGYVVGVKLDKDSVLVAICDLSCTIIHSSTVSLESNTPFERTLSTVVEAIQHCLLQAHMTVHDILGVGVGLSGRIDAERGICHSSPSFPWRNVALAAKIEEVLHIPVRIDNNINTLAVAEQHFGLGQASPNFLLLVIGRDIGLSVVLANEIYHGHHGSAGEYGHVIIDRSSTAPHCRCGQRGCLEAIVSSYDQTHVAPRQTATNANADKDPAVLRTKVASENEQADTALTYIGTMLGITLANLINIFDPNRVFMMGHIAQNIHVAEAMRNTMSSMLFDQEISSNILSIVEGDSIREEQWARGAASLVLNELFQPPLYEHGPQTMIVVEDLLVSASSRISSNKARKGLP
ncbi:xylose repressor protein [Dictyobacter alpinus]|uniref:Xylose repressor protein n=1 Tax=Dictyobacter alpinus TaxID=2014873 RepID=A0A402BE57_9CHLR|nr:ROK family protein [Dictyobacter alpinus]GCE29580.1 xylose repressor protein [Dictyobacter alpinus]